MLNAVKNHPSELMSMPSMDKDLITKYLEPSTATAKGHMVRVRKHIRYTHSNRPAKFYARQEIDDLAPVQQMCSAIENEIFCFAILRDEEKNYNLQRPNRKIPDRIVHRYESHFCVLCLQTKHSITTHDEEQGGRRNGNGFQLLLQRVK